MALGERITSVSDPSLTRLSQRLADFGGALESDGYWPQTQLDLFGQHGVFEWFIPTEWGGQAWHEADIFRGYLQLSSACLTTTFVLTQWAGACRRISASDNLRIKRQLLPDLCRGRTFATVGVSHLTTSRRHLDRPVLEAEETESGFVLDGYIPWVTGARYADHVVTGATLADGRQILVVVPTSLPGVTVPPAQHLLALQGSQTGEVRLDRVRIDRDWLLAGPVEEVMRQGVGAGTGGLQTSALAVGLATSAIEFLAEEASCRDDLQLPAQALTEEVQSVRDDFLHAADGTPVCSTEVLRTRANSLVLRATQAALAAAKGTGFVVGHPAGRWCREALFFLVWSCPQPVMSANLCEFAGLAEA